MNRSVLAQMCDIVKVGMTRSALAQISNIANITNSVLAQLSGISKAGITRSVLAHVLQMLELLLE